MIAFLARRLAWSAAVLLVVGILTFVLTYVLPADPARVVAGIHATVDDVARIRHALGLDRPFLEQIALYFGRVIQGDFGHSFQQGRDVLPLLLERLPATLELALGGIAMELLIGIPLGVYASSRYGRRGDRVVTTLAVLMVAAPPFWLGAILIYLLAFQPALLFHIDLFPIGREGTNDLRALFLPALTLGIGGGAYYARLTRTAMLEALGTDYIRTARAKGVAERAVHWRHGLRNALPILLTQLGLDLGLFLSGVVVVEAVFSWPGMGKLAVDSIAAADIPLILGTVLFGAVCIVAANLVIDLAYPFIDPRLRHRLH